MADKTSETKSSITSANIFATSQVAFTVYHTNATMNAVCNSRLIMKEEMGLGTCV